MQWKFIVPELRDRLKFMGYGQGGWRIFKGRIKGVNFFSLQSSNHLDFHFWKKSLLSSKSKQCWINLTVHSDNLTKRDLSFLRGFPFFMRALCFRSFFVSRYIFEHISYPIPHIFENLNTKKWKTPWYWNPTLVPSSLDILVHFE